MASSLEVRSTAGTCKVVSATSPLDDVVREIARLGDRRSVGVYVERRGTHFRWSIAVRGGPYPLLREVARFLRVPHTSLVVPCRSVDGWCIVAPARDLRTRVDAFGFVDPASDVVTVWDRVTRACGFQLN